MERLKNIIKFDSNEEYNNFIDDFSKYKSALYAFYEKSDEKFPFEDSSFKEDLFLVIFLNEYDYSHEIVLRVLDEILISKLGIIDKSLVLHFLCGFQVISENELKERNEILRIFSND